MKKFEVKIKGLCPLMQARHPTPDEEKEIAKRQGSSSSKVKVKELTDKEMFEMHAYKTKGGKFYQPSEMIEAAMVKAAVNFKWEGKKSYKDLIRGGIVVTPLEIVHKKQNFEMDARYCKNPTTRGAIWVVRPRIENWELEFTIELLQDERVPSSVLKEILEYAGIFTGVGCWRPKFGRFEVVSFKEIK